MQRVAVVGGGISGIACATSLVNRGVPVTIFDRGHRIGGRLATQTLRDTGTQWDSRVVDVGASYFTAHDVRFKRVVESLCDQGIAREWTDTIHVADATGVIGPKIGPVRYATSGGLRSVVQALADQLPADLVRWEYPHDVGGLIPRENGIAVGDDLFAAVAVCMPDPQAQRLFIDPGFEQARAVLANSPRWEPVLALTTVYESRCWQPFDAMFVNDDAAITFIANDGSRRGDDAPVLVTHSASAIAGAHLSDPNEAAPALMAAVAQVLDTQMHPSWFSVKRWTFARPTAARAELFGWAETPARWPIGLAGDSWAGGPRTETAWLSGTELGLALAASDSLLGD